MTSAWWRLTITADPAILDTIAATVVAATGQGVEELRRGVVATVLDSERHARELAVSLEQHFSLEAVSVERCAAVDWLTHWRDGIITRTFGRLVLTPSWLPATPVADQVVVTIDPESAFGSGEHGSTRGALALVERHLRPGDRVLDLGSGSGILSIAAAKLGARRAVGIDVDPEAIAVADANARKNSVAGAAIFLLGGAGELAPLVAPAEVICSNILRSVNTLLLPVVCRSLADRGTAIFAGMEVPERGLFLPVLESHDLEPVDELDDAGWWSVAARRR